MAIDNKDKKVLKSSIEREQNEVACSAECEKIKGSKNLNVPHLRFPEFQEEWKKCKLGDLCNVLMCKRILASQTNTEDGVPFYKIGTIGSTPDAYISKELFDDYKVKYSYPHKGEVMITCAGTVGKCVVYDGEDAYFQDSNIVWIDNPTQNISNGFLFHLLSKVDWRKLNSTTIIRIYNDDLRNLKMSYPQKEEQQKISHLLSLLDERITTQNKIIDKLQSLIRGINDSLYAQYGNEVKTSFANLGSSYSGLSGKSAQDFGSGKPFITYLNVYSNNVINEKDFQFVAIRDNEKQNVVEYGDVLFTLSSETPEEVGIGSVYLGKEKVYLNSFCFGIHITNTEVVYSPYLSYYVSSTPFRKFIYPYAQGSTRFNLCKADFEKASIKLPSLENQKRIYSILSHIESKTETEKSLLDLYNSQKQYLLRQMLI
ncbi:restriction endonuclease subunit S [Bacteroides ovatus]|uniref:restriction endonuclease subunit S n=1 Tax=Bacteroides ovatus TaxID=28116 RepID=UPI001F39FAF0|nr:restriction endonuclease subunit S [Bacteroides ovatus]MCE8751322.1 restriction endonuclease subunit S [Bacteroides ovatus]